MPVDKATRRARHEAAVSPKLNATNFATPNSGSEGQVVFREEGGTVKQLVKKNNIWRKVG
jgi:hypothetical protein